MNFSSITQNDKIFINTLGKGLSCGYFAILTAFNFLRGKPTDKTIHENNIMDFA